ncbi:sugar phosphate isomerase/epimerase [Oceanispirochaeta crateris]|uniref:Sugar phosphate isomerase/epimerase n=1 Tax=Oceanispirochaeta crateris TaxID=2518645 RepID=A0A5C1QNK0_9SPIO|nr:sugar phosphate isomerase/epimerase family protein [Oceanispirochaeta crateris]QEN08146.1 sugar phosphate isomerase/epimerase [Oceanispirochaeta crateris]
MSLKPKYAVITGFLGESQDRFRSYNAPRTLEEKFKMMNSLEDVDGVELVYPYEVNDPSMVKSLLGKYSLNMAAVNVNIKKDDDFINGSISHPDKAVRDKAVRFIKEAKDFAAEVGADKVQCCPLGDGYEYSFQSDYSTSWKRMVACLEEAGAYKPEIPLFIEYKPNEIRGRCFIDNSAKALCLLNDIGNKNVGVTLDFGHSIYGGETPAEALCLVADSPFPYYIHINDNDGRWDWDYMAGTRHFQEYLEFVYYVKRYGYSDYLTSDTSPTRVDIKECFEANARWTTKMWDLLDTLDLQELTKLLNQSDFVKNWKFLENEVFFKK